MFWRFALMTTVAVLVAGCSAESQEMSANLDRSSNSRASEPSRWRIEVRYRSTIEESVASQRCAGEAAMSREVVVRGGSSGAGMQAGELAAMADRSWRIEFAAQDESAERLRSDVERCFGERDAKVRLLKVE